MAYKIVGYQVRDNAFNREHFPKQVWAILPERPHDGPITYPLIRCDCGAPEPITCDDFTNTCEHCGADYNSNGDRLAPRSQWGEETGEHWSECY